MTKEYSVPAGVETAVDGVDLEIGESEFLSLVGPSGCGKSTTLRCIAGLETPTEGEILIDGEDVTAVAPNDRELAMMFQDIALYPHMTVVENVAYPLKVRGVPKAERNERAEEAAEIMRIDDLLEKYPGALSGGQRQRTALARTIVHDPRAFLMDEPLSDLDAKLKVAIRKEIQRVHNRVNKPTIYVTHDQAEALSMSDRVAVMNDGRIMGLGTPDELYHLPGNRFVASFIGNPSINFVSGSVTAHEGDTVVVDLHGTEIEVDTVGVESAYEDIEIGVRPEHTHLARGGEEGHVEGTLELVERIGDRRLASVDTVEGEIRILVPDERTPAQGETVSVRFDTDAIHVFDGRTGEAVAHGELSKRHVENRSSDPGADRSTA
ncbi:ABC transporter ATP-binding protein [Halobium palmae]|uniref:ABC-type D-xylose/L-arabinose transporter n=1 Tax=Halobium palmae TaxID=1776492 RepID=A0ABD5RYH8_9EURY